ncbi:MAG: bifunctional phosphopantothenoylcysteine decarboxylase/phosphopantothenate--cysteine ligase CoaBC [Deltaproteobacteria bacterium]
MGALDGKRVLLCVGGGIAAYKSAELVRQFIAAGASVQVAMTKAALEFISPLTLQTLSKQRVATDILSVSDDAEIGHIRIGDEADAVIVAPATAGLISRMASGMADDVVTAALLVTTAPVVVAPAMNTNMLEHPAVRENLDRLAGFGHRIVAPDSGELACGYEGPGRLPDPRVLVEETVAALSDRDLAGFRVLVSAGPTREPLDPVRFISNRSSGRMGYAVAEAAQRRGAEVTLVSGPVALAPPRGCRVIHVETAAEMNEAMRAHVVASDLVVMVAAVADYRMAEVSPSKIKKHDGGLELALERTEDILTGISRARGRRVIVGFAAETEDLIENAVSKLTRKGLDLIVANDVTEEGSGFDTETNSAVLIDASGTQERTGLIAKTELAELILDRSTGLLTERGLAASNGLR